MFSRLQSYMRLVQYRARKQAADLWDGRLLTRAVMLGEQPPGFSNELHLPLQNLKLAGELNEQPPEQARACASLIIPVHLGNPLEVEVISEPEEPPVHRRHLFDLEVMSQPGDDRGVEDGKDHQPFVIEIFDPANSLGDVFGRFSGQPHNQADQWKIAGFDQPADLLVAKLAPLRRFEGADLAALLIHVEQLSARGLDAQIYPEVSVALPPNEQVVNFAQVVVGIFGDGNDVGVIDLYQLKQFDFPKTADQFFQHGRVHRRTGCAAVTKEILAQGADRSHTPFDVPLDVGGDHVNRNVNHSLGRDRAELAALTAAAADLDHSHRSRAANRRDLIFMRTPGIDDGRQRPPVDQLMKPGRDLRFGVALDHRIDSQVAPRRFVLRQLPCAGSASHDFE